MGNWRRSRRWATRDVRGAEIGASSTDNHTGLVLTFFVGLGNGNSFSTVGGGGALISTTLSVGRAVNPCAGLVNTDIMLESLSGHTVGVCLTIPCSSAAHTSGGAVYLNTSTVLADVMLESFTTVDI